MDSSFVETLKKVSLEQLEEMIQKRLDDPRQGEDLDQMVDRLRELRPAVRDIVTGDDKPPMTDEEIARGLATQPGWKDRKE